MAVAFLFLEIGEVSISLSDLFYLFKQLIVHGQSYQLNIVETVVLYLRLPLLVASFLAGAAFALSGALMQGLLRNPLADPGVLGVSSGASLMVVLGLWFFSMPTMMGFSENIIILLLASLGSAVVLVMMYFVSKYFINGKTTGVLLAGIALASVFSSILMLVITFSNQNNLHFTLSWLMGGIQSISWYLLLFNFIILSISFLLMLRVAPALDMLSLGEVDAQAAGLDFSQLLIQVLILISVVMALSVSMAGPLAFIGLVSPHIARLLGMNRHKNLLIHSALIGGILVITSETIARNLLAPHLLPLGAVTSLFGAPFFLILLWRNRKLSLFI
ncbi:iron ABC transporter permease [Thiotrichales bacterium 19S9-12]|nr:iron ABC transporter permease [Thiotrichales bacterium 19S9-11]MCF6811486.1 iron ABC transporter permease [Thiotrichales bacterium 19S9-12]